MIFLKIILIALCLTILATFAFFAIQWFLNEVDDAVFNDKTRKF